MHEYSIKGHPRERYVFCLAIVAIIMVPLIRHYGAIAGVTATISTSAVFFVLYLIWDRYLWKFLGINRLYRLPDLSGNWDCDGSSSGADGEDHRWSGNVAIEQTWSKIAICVQSSTSRSRSSAAAIEYDAGHGYRVIYGYQNQPSSEQSQLLTHRGHCDLIFNNELTNASGNYFNDAHRKTWGDITLKRKNTNRDGI